MQLVTVDCLQVLTLLTSKKLQQRENLKTSENIVATAT